MIKILYIYSKLTLLPTHDFKTTRTSLCTGCVPRSIGPHDIPLHILTKGTTVETCACECVCVCVSVFVCAYKILHLCIFMFVSMNVCACLYMC